MNDCSGFLKNEMILVASFHDICAFILFSENKYFSLSLSFTRVLEMEKIES